MAERDYLRPDEIQVLCDATCGDMLGRGSDRVNNLGKWYKIVQCMINGCLHSCAFRPNEYFLSRVDKWFEDNSCKH